MNITTVHVVYKTHLDVGFTDYATNVTRQYLDTYIPAALDLADELERRNVSAGFSWTAGSWLIREALGHGSVKQRDKVDRGIREGKLNWHALPFSTHTELMDASLFEYAVSIAGGLDRHYGRTTIAAKMTDVPGHTLGMVPTLARAGIEYLHIGVNPASSVPDVPPVFRWRAPDRSEVVVHYDFAYGSGADGETYLIPGMEDALHIAFTNDNLGPPGIDSILELHDKIRRQFPGARVKASSLDAFARKLRAVRHTLPVIEAEIGDTWIHGPASDPVLLSNFRRLQALRGEWVRDGSLVLGGREHARFSDNLLLIAEHTWGEDIKTFLPDFTNWSKEQFAAARSADTIHPSITSAANSFAVQWSSAPTAQGHSYRAVEESWTEQRDRVVLALAALTPHRKALAERELRSSDPSRPERRWSVATGERMTAGQFQVVIADDGSLRELTDSIGRNWAGENNPIGRFSYESFGPAEYDRWLRQYCRDLDVNGDWAIVDFGKVGLELAAPPAQHTIHAVRASSIQRWADDESDVVHVTGVMPESATQMLGAPRKVDISYRFDKSAARLTIELRLRDKDANRLPEAAWFTIAPAGLPAENWTMTKMGVDLDPLRVVPRGNRVLHSVESLTNRAVTIVPRDASIVSLGAPALLQFSDSPPDLSAGFHFNLHNNVWGTNFRMWLEDDTAYEFELTFATASQTSDGVES